MLPDSPCSITATCTAPIACWHMRNGAHARSAKSGQRHRARRDEAICDARSADAPAVRQNGLAEKPRRSRAASRRTVRDRSEGCAATEALGVWPVPANQ